MSFFRIKKVLLPLLVVVTAVLVFYLFSSRSNNNGIRPADISGLPPVRVGDWVLRMGTVADSRIIRRIDGGIYSHIGMVVETVPQIMVVHATTDDGDDKQDSVGRVSLAEFFSPDLAREHAVIRPLFLSNGQKNAIARHMQTRVGQAFLLAAKNEDHLYCTTLLDEEIRRVVPSFSPDWKKVDVAFFSGEYLFPSAFANYPHTELIYRSATPLQLAASSRKFR